MKLTRSAAQLPSAALAISPLPFSGPGSAQQAKLNFASRTLNLSFYGATRI